MNLVTAEMAMSALLLPVLIDLGISIVSASHDREAIGDLTLRTLSQEVRGALLGLDTSTAVVVPVSWETAHGSVSTDTIAFDVRRTIAPSMRRGGFLADNAEAFNRAQRRAAWLAAMSPSTRTAGRHSGLIGTSGKVDDRGNRNVVFDQSALVVQSPFAERAWHTVLAHDSRVFEGLIRAAETIRPELLERIVRPEVRALNWCAGVLRSEVKKTDLYCGDMVGARIGLNADFDLGSNEAGEFTSVTKGRVARLWINGTEAIGASTAIQRGDLLFARPAGAMIISRAVSGVIAGKAVINGQQKFVLVDGPLRPMATALARGNPAVHDADTTVLALHASFTRELDSAITRFLFRHEEIERAEVVALDGWTGGIRSLAGSRQLGSLGYVPGFEPGFVGSLVKPIIATAILSRQPQLASLVINGSPGKVDIVQGISVHPFNALHTGRIDLARFLEISSNEYAVELVFRSLLLSPGGHSIFDGTGNVAVKRLEDSDLANGLLEYFDVQTGGEKSAKRDQAIWLQPDTARGIVPSMSSQPWFWPWESHPSLFVDRGNGIAQSRKAKLDSVRTDSIRGTTATNISRFAYGQGYNEWTLVGAAQAIARVVTGRKVKARMLERNFGDSTVAFAWRSQNWTSEIRRGMHGVVTIGTASGLEDSFQATFGGEAITVFGKTGTAQKNDKDTRADRNTLGLFITSRVAGMAAPDCGLSVALAVDYVNGKPSETRDHVEFAEQVIAPLIARHWSELVTCRK